MMHVLPWDKRAFKHWVFRYAGHSVDVKPQKPFMHVLMHHAWQPSAVAFATN